MIYEERRVVARSKNADEYLAHIRKNVAPSLAQYGGQPLLYLSGLIGDPANEIVQITLFPDLVSWQQAQQNCSPTSTMMVESEEVRLFRAVSSRPKPQIPAEDRRAVYGYRKFFIDPTDLDEFVHCSEQGIWPRIESHGACILGLWSPISCTNPMEVVIATGYHSPSHWEQTRFGGKRPDGVSEELWEKERPLRERRVEITKKMYVRLMQAHPIKG